MNESCDIVCAAEGLPCTDGDWGVHDQASLEAALEAAGQSSSDRASLCSGAHEGAMRGYQASNWGGCPATDPAGYCYWQSGAATSCSATYSHLRRLCRCV